MNVKPCPRRIIPAQKLRPVSRWDQFVGMSLSQLAGQQSLRDIESTLKSRQTKLAASRLRKTLKPELIKEKLIG